MELGSNALWLLPNFEVEYKYEQPTSILQNLQYYLMYVRKKFLRIISTVNEKSIGQAGMDILHQ